MEIRTVGVLEYLGRVEYIVMIHLDEASLASFATRGSETTESSVNIVKTLHMSIEIIKIYLILFHFAPLLICW